MAAVRALVRGAVDRRMRDRSGAERASTARPERVRRPCALGMRDDRALSGGLPAGCWTPVRRPRSGRPCAGRAPDARPPAVRRAPVRRPCSGRSSAGRATGAGAPAVRSTTSALRELSWRNLQLDRPPPWKFCGEGLTVVQGLGVLVFEAGNLLGLVLVAG